MQILRVELTSTYSKSRTNAILRVEQTSTRSKCRSNVYKYKLEPMATTVVELMTRSR